MRKENTIMTSTERKYEELRNSYKVLQYIFNKKPRDYQAIARATGFSWPTIKNKINKLIDVGVLSKEDPFELCPETLQTMYFVGIYFNGDTVECVAINLKAEQVSFEEIFQKDKYSEYLEIVENPKIGVLAKITYLYYLFEQEAHILKIAISMIGIGKIGTNGENIVQKGQFVLKKSLFNNANKMVICETIHSAYKVLKEQYSHKDIWYLYVSDNLIYLLGDNVESISKGLITPDKEVEKAINTLSKQEIDKYTICEAKDIVLKQVIPFVRFVSPNILTVDGLLNRAELKNSVYSDLKSVATIEKIEFEETHFAKSIAIFAMYDFIENSES